MRFLTRCIVPAVVAAAIASSLAAVTYIVPEDRDLVRQARAVVVATAESSHSQLAPDGRIVTICELRIDDVLKGDLQPGSLLRLTEPGGIVGDRMLGIPGAPRYANGAKYIVFGGQNGSGELATLGMGMGRFALHRDAVGREIAERLDADNDAIAGGSSIRGAVRDVHLFAEFIRAVDRGDELTADYFVETALEPPAESSRATSFAKHSDYLMLADSTTGAMARWQVPATTFLTRDTQPRFLDGGLTAASNAAVTWSTAGGSVAYSVGGTTTASGGLTTSDGVSSIQFNDPNGYVAGHCEHCVAIGGFWASGTHTIDGETFFTVTEVDIEMGANVSRMSESDFQGILTHEMGHTLGFRHSNLTADNEWACAAPLPCAAIGSAIMASTYISGMAPTLKQWDRDAVMTVYPAVTVVSRRRAVRK